MLSKGSVLSQREVNTAWEIHQFWEIWKVLLLPIQLQLTWYQIQILNRAGYLQSVNATLIGLNVIDPTNHSEQGMQAVASDLLSFSSSEK